MSNAPRSPFGSGVTFGRDDRGNAKINIAKGTPIASLPPELRRIFDSDAPSLMWDWKPTKYPRQCFALSSEVMAAASQKEVEATFKDMEELGIAKPPYPEFDILMKARDVFAAESDQWEHSPEFKASDVIVRYHSGETVDVLFDWKDGYPIHSLFNLNQDQKLDLSPERYGKFLKSIIRNSRGYYKLLITLLATRNVEKLTVVNKLAKLGIGKNKDRSWYTTTLKIGHITETIYERGEPTGRTVRAHLRRGHKRNQRWGPGFQFSRVVFIEPMFINADEHFVSDRTAYNVSKGT